MTTKRLALIAAIQTASRQRDGGTYRPQIVSRDVCLVIWEENGREEIAAIVEIERGILTWNADSSCHGELAWELWGLDVEHKVSGRDAPIFAAARQEVLL